MSLVPELLEFDRLFAEKFEDYACPTCGKFNCTCDEDTMRHMEEEREG